jgi:hypothetical protein
VPPKRPIEAGHVVVVAQTTEKKRKNAQKHSLDIKTQIAQRLQEAGRERAVPELQVRHNAFSFVQCETDVH